MFSRPLKKQLGDACDAMVESELAKRRDITDGEFTKILEKVSNEVRTAE